MLWIVAGMIILFFIILLICFYMAFYSPKRKRTPELPNGEIYEVWRETLTSYIKKVREFPCREVEITSHDGLKLRGKYFEYSPDAPIELMFHGYRGSAESDLSGGVLRCRSLGHSSLIVNNRGSGNSEGRVITFGVRESLDVPLWVDFILKEINPDAKIILTGISMGASTVMLASANPLPKSVVGVLADCGYTSAADIIKKVIRDMKLPKFVYHFVRFSGIILGGFDIKSADCKKAVSKTSLPTIFFHGNADAFVPCDMSRENYEACKSRKKFVVTDGAGHGLSYPVNPEKYLEELDIFFSFV